MPVKTSAGALSLSLILAAVVVLPGVAGAQSLRLEDPIRAQERWQRNFDREQREQSRDARDREQDRAILRELEDQARQQEMRDSEREFRESIRERQRQEERDQDWLERRRERAGTCNSSSANFNPTFCPGAR